MSLNQASLETGADVVAAVVSVVVGAAVVVAAGTEAADWHLPQRHEREKRIAKEPVAAAGSFYPFALKMWCFLWCDGSLPCTRLQNRLPILPRPRRLHLHHRMAGALGPFVF